MKYQALFSGKDMYYLTSIYICDLNSLPVCKDTICVLHHKKQQKPTHHMSLCLSEKSLVPNESESGQGKPSTHHMDTCMDMLSNA